MSKVPCSHASSGCDYPAGECSGACMAKQPRRGAPAARQAAAKILRDILFVLGVGIAAVALSAFYSLTNDDAADTATPIWRQ